MKLMMLLVVQFTIFFIQTNGKPFCLFNCTASGDIGRPLDIPASCQQHQTADNCRVNVKFSYHDRKYTVEFLTSFISHYYRSIHVFPSNDLSYTAMYACSDNNICAIEFAKNKVLDLSNRTYNVESLTSQIRNVLLEQRLPTAPALRCDDNEECNQGLCRIEFDTKKNEVTGRSCVSGGLARVHVFDGGSLPSMSLECNRTRCNSPQTINQVKEILFRHNLTDINGRINYGQKTCASTVYLIITLHFLAFYILSFSHNEN